MSGPGYRFENELLNALRDSFPNTFSYRFKQSKRVGQPWDLLVLPPHLSAIECKSRNISDRKTLKLEQLFREGQLEAEMAREKRYGITAYLFLEMRRGRGYTKRCYYESLKTISHKKIEVQNPDMTKIEREEGKYIIPDNFPDI